MAERCPLCRVRIPPAGAHCPSCGTRVAALPRRARIPRADRPVHPGAVGLPSEATGVHGARGVAHMATTLSGRTSVAAAQGAAAALLVAASTGVIALGVRAAGGNGDTLFGNLTLAAGGLAICAAVLAGGVRVRRWAEYDELLDRHERGRRVGVRRVALLAAAFVLLAVSGVTAALN